MTGIRTKGHTVELCRLMVRVTDTKTRLILSHLLLDADLPCRRLFLDYHGLKILNSWMSDLTWKSHLDLDIKMALEDVLSILNIPHKTMLVDSNVWQTISSWAIVKDSDQIQDNSTQNIKDEIKHTLSEASSATTSPTPSSNTSSYPTAQESELESTDSQLRNKEHCLSTALHQRLSNTCEISKSLQDLEDISIVGSVSSNKGQDIANLLSNQKVEERSIGEHEQMHDTTKPDVLPIPKADQQQNEMPQQPLDPLIKHEYTVKHEDAKRKIGDEVTSNDVEINDKILMVKEKAMSLLGVWINLKEVFRIPRKELVKLRAEHERELEDAEKHSKTNQIAALEDLKLSGNFRNSIFWTDLNTKK